MYSRRLRSMTSSESGRIGSGPRPETYDGIKDADSQSYLPQNAAVHSPLLRCPQCGRTYKMKRNLRTHMRFECGGQKNFRCHICPSSYTQNISLRRHLMQQHGIYLPPKFSSTRKVRRTHRAEQNTIY
ncbi:zinc finger protein 408-like isoform X2 [Pseudomyrmex gracilis]|uniref:zinc finger protein 408-like isoform X2 n=1 Tax=Pseudomyrmex gracilis TaxID=219809 RepID=UPI000994F771|nr:zinc finger protein 408-like isoform X2 [Pseudomyrmex gracilis]